MANIVKNVPEPHRDYEFKNAKAEGSAVRYFSGTAPVISKGEKIEDTIKQYCLNDGEVSKLPPSEVRRLRNRGTEKPVLETGADGRKRFSGKTRLDRRFEVYEV